MLHQQHSQASSFSLPMNRRDFISLLPKRCVDHVAENILSYLDAISLCEAELVCKEWYKVISEGKLWKKLIERRVRIDSLWKRLAERRGWIIYLFEPVPGEPHPDHVFYRRLYPKIIQDIENIEINWRCIARNNPKIIYYQSEIGKGLCCVKCDDHKIVSGLHDSTIKIWDRNTLECIHVLTGHTEAVKCLQFDDKVIISGSHDSTVRVWDVKTGELINTLNHHAAAVLNLRFNKGMLVTSSSDGSVTVWNMVSPSEITVRRVLVGHRYPVTAADFDEKYIVSASLDGTIKVWNTTTCEFFRTLEGHKGGVLCLQYHDRLVVSGSNDKTIKVWNIESGECLRTLEGHQDIVTCIQFDNKRIVSGASIGEIKVWDLAAALDLRAPAGNLCLGTSVNHFGFLESLQFDDLEISCLSDNTILIWDLLNVPPPETDDRNLSEMLEYI